MLQKMAPRMRPSSQSPKELATRTSPTIHETNSAVGRTTPGARAATPTPFSRSSKVRLARHECGYCEDGEAEKDEGRDFAVVPPLLIAQRSDPSQRSNRSFNLGHFSSEVPDCLHIAAHRRAWALIKASPPSTKYLEIGAFSISGRRKRCASYARDPRFETSRAHGDQLQGRRGRIERGNG
jgi:hypothetical protein